MHDGPKVVYDTVVAIQQSVLREWLASFADTSILSGVKTIILLNSFRKYRDQKQFQTWMANIGLQKVYVHEIR